MKRNLLGNANSGHLHMVSSYLYFSKIFKNHITGLDRRREPASKIKLKFLFISKHIKLLRVYGGYLGSKRR